MLIARVPQTIRTIIARQRTACHVSIVASTGQAAGDDEYDAEPVPDPVDALGRGAATPGEPMTGRMLEHG